MSTEHTKITSKAFSYLKIGLGATPKSQALGLSKPLKEAFIFLLDDLFNKKLPVKEFDRILKELYSLQFLSGNMHSEDPELWMAWENAFVLSHPETQHSLQTRKEKKEAALKSLRDYLKKNKGYLKQLKALSLYLGEQHNYKTK